MKDRLIVLTGPTAVGKTAVGLRLAKRLDAEIISADSMQVYRGMDIGTDKISREEMQGIPHHLIDILEPTEPFNVVRFQTLAKEAVRDINARGRIPLLTGGTAFYIRALLYDTDFTETDEDTALRREMEEEVLSGGDAAKEALHARLSREDPVSAEMIPKENVRRVIRALEFFEKTGTPISEHNKRERAKPSPYDFRYFVLTDDRAHLYERINERVLRMFERGLAEEVRGLRDRGVSGEMTSMQGLGYREVFRALEEGRDPMQVAEKVQQNTRHFAKRQLTWFRAEKDAEMIDKRDYDRSDERIAEALECMISQSR
ncbi:MAG: tRNA (adenosine(37)-N6)-dimethylallyltransferase MiaA [Lachnospiraceae bacterium]|nr:tRNA (adenosine(37)-N6)-dimethylallyltransferase MiaA [Lachnospiraceae bacterium]